MTPKQETFVRAVISGSNPSDAYRAAYDASRMSDKTVANEAYKLMQNPDIAAMIEKGEAEALDAAVWSRRIAINRLSAVNKRCFDALMGDGISRVELGGFMDTTSMLNDLTNVKSEIEEDRRSRFGSFLDSIMF